MARELPASQEVGSKRTDAAASAKRAPVRDNTDDYPAIYLIYVLVMFAGIAVAAVVAALIVFK